MQPAVQLTSRPQLSVANQQNHNSSALHSSALLLSFVMFSLHHAPSGRSFDRLPHQHTGQLCPLRVYLYSLSPCSPCCLSLYFSHSHLIYSVSDPIQYLCFFCILDMKIYIYFFQIGFLHTHHIQLWFVICFMTLMKTTILNALVFVLQQCVSMSANQMTGVGSFRICEYGNTISDKCDALIVQIKWFSSWLLLN